MMYDTGNYAGTRINNTIVMHKRKPFYVDSVSEDRVVHGHRLDMSRRSINVIASDVSLLSFTLGFLNKDGRAYYMSRRAMRHDWRQGLRPNNVQCVPYLDVDYKDIAKCLLHRYPTLAQALGKVGSGAKSCAWCPSFCVTSTGLIYWKHYAIGTIKDDTINLSREFKFLAKELKGCTHGCYEMV